MDSNGDVPTFALIVLHPTSPLRRRERRSPYG